MASSIKVSGFLVTTGMFCTVTFLTNSGEVRTVNGRTGVHKYTTGTGKRSNLTAQKYILLYTRNGSPKFNAPKNIARDRIIGFKAHGINAGKNNTSTYAKNV